jgi:hypothetical protein
MSLKVVIHYEYSFQLSPARVTVLPVNIGRLRACTCMKILKLDLSLIIPISFDRLPSYYAQSHCRYVHYFWTKYLFQLTFLWFMYVPAWINVTEIVNYFLEVFARGLYADTAISSCSHSVCNVAVRWWCIINFSLLQYWKR